MIVKVLAEGGNMQPGPALSQKLGPAGINVGEVIKKVNEDTKDFKGLKVPVELDIDPSTKTFEVKVFSPPVSELIKSQLKITKGSGKQLDIKSGNLSIEQVINVARQKKQNLLCNDLKAAVKSVVGTCQTLGVLVESKSPQKVQEEINNGDYDKQIQNEETETPEDKKKELDAYFSKISKAQEKLIKEEQEKAKAKKK